VLLQLKQMAAAAGAGGGDFILPRRLGSRATVPQLVERANGAIERPARRSRHFLGQRKAVPRSQADANFLPLAQAADAAKITIGAEAAQFSLQVVDFAESGLRGGFGFCGVIAG